MSQWERDNTATSMRGIHDTTEVRETDGEMEIFLHDLARKENSDFIRKIADRFAMLIGQEQNRKNYV